MLNYPLEGAMHVLDPKAHRVECLARHERVKKAALEEELPRLRNEVRARGTGLLERACGVVREVVDDRAVPRILCIDIRASISQRK
jgi:hypothetical protein